MRGAVKIHALQSDGRTLCGKAVGRAVHVLDPDEDVEQASCGLCRRTASARRASEYYEATARETLEKALALQPAARVMFEVEDSRRFEASWLRKGWRLYCEFGDQDEAVRWLAEKLREATFRFNRRRATLEMLARAVGGER